MYSRAKLWNLILYSFSALGIINPIEAKVRKGKGAVGAYGNERTTQSLQDFPVADSEEEEEKVNCCFFKKNKNPKLYIHLDVFVWSFMMIFKFFFLTSAGLGVSEGTRSVA